MIAILGKSEEKNAQVRELMKYMDLYCSYVDFFNRNSSTAYTPWNYYLSEGPGTMDWPLFWLDLKTPPYHSFKSSDMRTGEICDGEDIKARVFFREPWEDQSIEYIDWLRNADVYVREFYNKSGIKTSEALLGNESEILVTYYDEKGHPSIIHWPENDTVFVKTKAGEQYYGSMEEFNRAFLHDMMGVHDDRTICFYEPEVLRYIPDGSKNILLLFENTSGELKNPYFLEKLSVIATLQSGSSDRIRKDVSGKLPRIIELGTIINSPTGQRTPDALIVTRSQNIEQLQRLVEGLPELHFHIAAGTMMAPGLMEYGRYENVTLYPNYSRAKIMDLMGKCALYLDINHYLEYEGIIYAAQKADRLIYAFDNTVHQRERLPERNIFKVHETDEMIKEIRSVVNDSQRFEESLVRQRKIISITDQQMAEFKNWL